jgi:hypothetical protein
MIARKIVGLALLVVGCSGSEEGEEKKTTPVPNEPLTLTTEATVAPEHAVVAPDRSPSDPVLRAAMLAEGFGKLVPGPGEPYQTRIASGTPPAAGANAKRLVRFVHMPDLQLADDESPTRLAAFDSPGATAGAYRPQDAYLCRIVNAAVKSVNELAASDPFDFLLLGGDNADSAQTNEIDWVLALLTGGEVDCDSGANDPKKPGGPFTAPGLVMPWYWVTGNHDILIQGNLPVTDQRIASALGTTATGGTRDWTQNGGPVSTFEVAADEKRKPLLRTEIMQRIAGHGDGHGLGPEQEASGKAIYTFDVPNSDLRFLVIDTAAETGGSEGVIHQADIDAVIKPKLDAAVTENKLVILASHHATSSLGTGEGLGGEIQPDAVLEPGWFDFVGNYPNVVFSMVGHTHANRVKLVGDAAKHQWWEIMTSALADFPHQLRLIEIWDQDNGFLMLRATNVDFSNMGDGLASEGRALGVLDYTSGWSDVTGPGASEDRNVEVWIAKP